MAGRSRGGHLCKAVSEIGLGHPGGLEHEEKRRARTKDSAQRPLSKKLEVRDEALLSTQKEVRRRVDRLERKSLGEREVHELVTAGVRSTEGNQVDVLSHAVRAETKGRDGTAEQDPISGKNGACRLEQPVEAVAIQHERFHRGTL